MTDRQTDIKPHHRTWTWMLLKHRHIGSDIKLTNYNLYEKICYFWVFFFLHWQHPNNIESNMSRYQTKMMAVNTYFVISKEPESRGLVVFIVRDAQVVRSRLQNGVLVPRRLRFGFTFRHLAGVQGCLHRPAGCNGKKRRQPILVGSPLRLPRRFPAGHFPRTLKGAQKHPAEATWPQASRKLGERDSLPSISAASPSSSSSSSSPPPSSSAHVADVAFMFLSWDLFTFRDTFAVISTMTQKLRRLTVHSEKLHLSLYSN